VLGNVTDSSGAAIQDAKVTLLNTGTSEARSIQTDANGAYQFVNLVPGVYRLTIEKTGFKRQAREGLQVVVQAALRADVSLDIGELSQTVEVSAQTGLLQTEQSSWRAGRCRKCR
jgi:hypothetical protein